MKKNIARSAEQPEKKLEFSEFKHYTQNDYTSDIIAQILEETNEKIIMQISDTILEKDKKQ